MVYPETPFTNKFNGAAIFHLNKCDSVGKEEYDLEKLLKWLCTTPKITSYRVNTLKYKIEDIQKNLEGILKQTYKNENYTNQIMRHPILPDVLIVTSFQEKNLQKYLKEVVVDPICGAAILRGAHIFAPGVLAMQSGTNPGDTVSIFVDLSRKCKKGLKITYDDPGKLFIANGEVVMGRNELFAENLEPSGIAVKIFETISGVPTLDTTVLPTDSMLLQNIPSIVCGHILNPKPGEIILDMCASPGNKTTHIGILMEKKGSLIALDKTPNKVAQLKKNCENFSLPVHVFEFDATKAFDKNLKITENINKGPPFAGETFDRILLDAPCSNLGRRPQLYNNITEKEARSYVPLQRKLFTNAVHLLKSGGHLVYSTCTIMLAENEGLVSWALENFDLELRLATPYLGGRGWDLTKLNQDQLDMVQRFGQSEDYDTVGFFIAYFVKK